jgi:hypothetical protein
MFDRSLLPPADWEFVVIADMHLMVSADEVEFASRRLPDGRWLGLAGDDQVVLLALPDSPGERFAFALPDALASTDRARRIDLQRGSTAPTDEATTDLVVDRPTLFAFE